MEYGKAGDCYSRANCPQGQFSIDLRGTDLGLSPEVTWVSLPKSSSAHLSINKIVSNQLLKK